MPATVSSSEKPAPASTISRQMFTLFEIRTGVPQARDSATAIPKFSLVRRQNEHFRCSEGAPFQISFKHARESNSTCFRIFPDEILAHHSLEFFEMPRIGGASENELKVVARRLLLSCRGKRLDQEVTALLVVKASKEQEGSFSPKCRKRLAEKRSRAVMRSTWGGAVP